MGTCPRTARAAFSQGSIPDQGWGKWQDSEKCWDSGLGVWSGLCDITEEPSLHPRGVTVWRGERFRFGLGTRSGWGQEGCGMRRVVGIRLVQG